MAFKIICNEIVAKKIEVDDALIYTALRLREIGDELNTFEWIIKLFLIFMIFKGFLKILGILRNFEIFSEKNFFTL